jgi:diadenosine tetraphosphate (Ap4A) HIT family hydrolase
MTPEYLNLCGENAPSRVMAWSPQVVAVVAIGPLEFGNVIVLPRSHVRSLAHLEPAELREFELISEDLLASVEKCFGRAISFEHGMPSDPTSPDESCIDHAHLQIVPTELDLLPYVENDLGMGASIADLSDLSRYAGSEPYLYVRSSHSGRQTMFPLVSLPSQYIRKLYCGLTGRGGEWNWRRHPRCSWMSQSLSMFRSD